LPDYHEFSIKDNGRGINEDQHEMIFELFKKVHQEKNIKGSGVGLTIVKSIIEQHRGKNGWNRANRERGQS
jgi:signal transduction histidine kinase